MRRESNERNKYIENFDNSKVGYQIIHTPQKNYQYDYISEFRTDLEGTAAQILCKF